MKITLDTWIVSDTHFGHNNIIRYCNRPADHDLIMVGNWMAAVGEDEDVLHLGDLIFRKSSVNVQSLRGRKHLIKGNHDREKDSWYQAQGFEIMPRKMFFNWNGKPVLFTHVPEVEHKGWSVNIHGHIHNNGYHQELELDRDKDYRNVSIEVMEYKPVRLREILDDGKYEAIKSRPQIEVS